MHPSEAIGSSAANSITRLWEVEQLQSGITAPVAPPFPSEDPLLPSRILYLSTLGLAAGLHLQRSLSRNRWCWLISGMLGMSYGNMRPSLELQPGFLLLPRFLQPAGRS